ncbi:MAG: methenyltetrahydromethanopterin cyclohydrolase [Candidatus Altiarchaeota archaeon]
MNINEESFKFLLEKIARKEFVEELSFGSFKVYLADLNKIFSLEDAVEVVAAGMGLLGKVEIEENRIFVEIPDHVSLAALGCQMGGWGVRIDEKNVAIASGPARILARKPSEIFDSLDYNEKSEKGVLFLETDVSPSPSCIQKVLEKTGANELILAYFSGSSLFGFLSVLGRVVEQGVFRLNHLGYDINQIKSGRGTVEIPLFQKGNPDSMFLANDAIIYSGDVELVVEDWNPDLTEKCVSSSSLSYGKTFKEIFLEAGKDFYKIDEAIFAPAKITIHDKKNGMAYGAGKVRKSQE